MGGMGWDGMERERERERERWRGNALGFPMEKLTALVAQIDAKVNELEAHIKNYVGQERYKEADALQKHVSAAMNRVPRSSPIHCYPTISSTKPILTLTPKTIDLFLVSVISQCRVGLQIDAIKAGTISFDTPPPVRFSRVPCMTRVTVLT